MKIMVDGLFIRSLLLAFFFKLMPEIILAGKLFIAEPPLYRVDDKKNPFVINMADYNSRYVKMVSKDYRIGYVNNKKDIDINYLDKDVIMKFLYDSRHYEEDMVKFASHYKYRDRNCNERLIEMILEEFAYLSGNEKVSESELMNRLNIQKLSNRIGEDYKEIYFDDKDSSFKGIIDAQPQYIEVSTDFIRDGMNLINVLRKWVAPRNGSLILKENKTGAEHQLSILETLKMLRKYKPHILHRFKGLAENSTEDLRTTIMDPNTRMLIRINIGDIENDMEIFQVLRGESKKDLMTRKLWMKEFENEFDRDLIDT